MRILILLWPWALLWLSLQIIFLISSFMNSMFARYWSVMWLVGERKTVLFSLIEHWFAKKTVTEIFLDVFIVLAFHSSTGFALFQVWLLTHYFYFSSKADKFCLFFWIIVFNFLFIQRGSWLLKILVSLGIKFVMILGIVSLKIEICLLTSMLEKALSQLNWDMDRWIRSLFASWSYQRTRSYGVE